MPHLKLFLDHDGTITYFDMKQGKWKYKDGLRDFLKFITDNFECYWCSGCGHEEIISGLVNEGIEKELLDKILYFDYPYYSKAQSIIELTKEFVFIDDDGNNEEFKYLKRIGLKNNFIKADAREKKDLIKIMKILKLRIK